MKLKDVKINAIVKNELQEYGYIKDIAENSYRELLLVIKWQNGTITTIHPENIEEVK